MSKAAILCLSCLIIIQVAVQGDETWATKYPFPQGEKSLATYAVKPRMPTNVPADQMNAKMVNLLKRILEENLIFDTQPEEKAKNPAFNPFTKANFRMVLEHHTDWPASDRSYPYVIEQHLNVSESQGYGMLILALMAGCEKDLEAAGFRWRFDATNVKDYYDGFLRTVLRFPSSINKNQFAWELFGHNSGKNETGLAINDIAGNRTRGYRYLEDNALSPKVAPLWNTARDQPVSGSGRYEPNGNDSATDGDMDIMYSLILADKQWGSGGTYNYRKIALDMLDGFWKSLVNPSTHHLKLGDWANNNTTSGYGRGTRPSDFIMSHLKAYKAFDPGHNWQAVIDATYDVIAVIRESQAAQGRPDNGLLPDFVVRNESAPVYKWEPAPSNFLEGSNDGTYAYNSCRIPWRLGTDYLLYGDTAIRNKSLKGYILDPINKMAETAAGSVPSNTLNGLGQRKLLTDATFSGGTNATFAVPFLVSAAAISSNQAWINALWNYANLANHQNNWYADYYKLLCMITASGNYWKPETIK
jgi:hypothetical protein